MSESAYHDPLTGLGLPDFLKLRNEPMDEDENNHIGKVRDGVICLKDGEALRITYRKRRPGYGSMILWLWCPRCGLEVVEWI